MAPGEPLGGYRGSVRINLRPLADALPLGLYSFGIGMLVLAAQTAGWIPVSQSEQVGIVMASFVFPLEAVATVFAFLERDTLAATVLGLFTTSWLTLGLSLIVGPPGVASLTLGFYLMAFAGAIYALAALAFSGKPLITLLLLLSGTRAVLDGLYQLSGDIGLEHAAGYVAAAIAGVAWYAGTAFALEDLRQRPLLPVFRRGLSRTAIEGGVEEQVRPAAAEAGVRQQL